MKDDRLRSPVKPEYVEAIGRAAYTFASCEWQVAWSCERIQPGSLQKLVDEELTAGRIAKKFIDLCRNMPKSKEREELQAIAQRFAELVLVRNAILHGKPCTAPDGEQRLSADKIIEISDLEIAADDFVECGSKLNEIYYRFLNSYMPPLAK
jgi:hypothetical protein